VNTETAQQSEADYPKDVCYICGSDLSKLSGIRGRVAHMKRCSAKHGKISLGSDIFDGDLEAEEVEALPLEGGKSDTSSLNPYSGNQWHGGANASTLTAKSQSKQTALDKFFKAPVRSLTNILMAGSKRLAKSKSIEEKAKSESTAGNKPRGKWGGSWRSSQNRGNCPGYKKIPGTDFICDGFQYARCIIFSFSHILLHFASRLTYLLLLASR
jgi:hypothetical protein